MNPKTAVAYLRVSTDEQHRGPEAQRTRIETYALERGLKIVKWCGDLGISGAAPPGGRPGLRCVLASVAAHRAGVVLIDEQSRLTRDGTLAGFVAYTLKDMGAVIESADGKDNDGSFAERITRTAEREDAGEDRRKISDRTKAALAVKRARGERISRHAPYGFRLSGSKLLRNPEEEATVARMLALRAEGLSYRAIGAKLMEEGHKPRGRGVWQASTIRQVVVRAFVADLSAKS